MAFDDKFLMTKIDADIYFSVSLISLDVFFDMNDRIGGYLIFLECFVKVDDMLAINHHSIGMREIQS